MLCHVTETSSKARESISATKPARCTCIPCSNIHAPIAYASRESRNATKRDTATKTTIETTTRKRSARMFYLPLEKGRRFYLGIANSFMECPATTGNTGSSEERNKEQRQVNSRCKGTECFGPKVPHGIQAVQQHKNKREGYGRERRKHSTGNGITGTIHFVITHTTKRDLPARINPVSLSLF